jgi:hypothetical protein
MNGSRLSGPSLLMATAPLLVVGALALAACGNTGTTAPAHSWLPGASPATAVSMPPQAATTQGFRASSNGWDGLLHGHSLGLHDADAEELLAQTTVQTDNPSDGAYRFASITCRQGGST